MITVYLGDTGEYLAKLCVTVDPNAVLITQSNLNDLKPGVYYTSIADVGSLTNLGSVLRQATKIVYAPPRQWSDHDKNYSMMQKWSEDYLSVFAFRCKVENFKPVTRFKKDVILALEDKRKTQEPQLWVVGCSVSIGIGVPENKRYGHLISNRLKMPVSYLARGSTSIMWASDQILRSDIRTGDIVIWGLTSWSRTAFFIDNRISHINAESIARFSSVSNLINPETLESDNLFYQSLISVFHVIQFCQKINAKLIIASLLDDCISQYLTDQPNFIMLYNLWGRDLPNKFIDLGFDGAHPGIQTHAFYADQIYEKLQQLEITTQ